MLLIDVEFGFLGCGYGMGYDTLAVAISRGRDGNGLFMWEQFLFCYNMN